MKAVLFKERVKRWAELNGVLIKEVEHIETTMYYYIEVDLCNLIYWRELKQLEEICNNMGLEIKSIDMSIKYEDTISIWIS